MTPKERDENITLSTMNGPTTKKAIEDAIRIREAESDARRAAYIQGVMDGMNRYAWWKDGVEMVGTCGTTYKQAVEELRKEMNDDQSK